MSTWNFIVDFFTNLRADFISWLQGFGLSSGLIKFLDGLVGMILILIIMMSLVMLFIWMERRIVGRFQIRLGPNRVGPWGLLQPVADAIKVLLKEDVVPAAADKWVHYLAPIVVFIPTLLFFAVIPVGYRATFADLNIGILYIVAVGTLGIIGIFMGGWASNNKYSLIGAQRGVAQMISYEVPMVLSIVGVILIAGSLQMSQIVNEQQVPFIFLQPLGFLVYFLGASAELNRSPMDLLEAEGEIVAGYHTEYSGMKFSLFYLAEYGNAVAVSAIITTLFLAGWKGPGLPAPLWFLLKVLGVFTFMLWIRATLPRLRIDQLMGFAWKTLLPLALVNVFITAAEVLAWRTWMDGWQRFPWPFLFLNFALAAVLIVLWAKFFFKFGGGRVEVVRPGHSQGHGADAKVSLP